MDSVLERINHIMLSYTQEYQMRQIAERDVGEELIKSIREFLHERQDTEPVLEIKRTVFKDAQSITDEDITDVVDALVNSRSRAGIEEIDSRSIDIILGLFEEWQMREQPRLEEIALESFPELEAQIETFEHALPDLYGGSEASTPNLQSTGQKLYTGELPPVAFMTREDFDPDKMWSYMSGVGYR